MTIADFVTVEWAPASDPTSTTPTWVDITDIVMEVTVSGGRSGVFDLYGPRTATIVCRNGRKSPAEAPTFDIQGFYKWRQIRVTRANGDPLFTGHILALEHDQTESPFVGWVTISGIDKMGVLARAEFNADAGSTVNGIDTAVTLLEAVTAALDQSLLDSASLTFVSGSTAYFKFPDRSDPDDPDSFPTGNILQWVQDVFEGEAGTFQYSADGGVYVRGRWQPFQLAPSGATPTAVFSDTATGAEYKYLRENLTFAPPDQNYYTRAVAKSANHDPVFEVDSGDATIFRETLSRTDLPFIYQSWAEANAAHWFRLYNETPTFPRSLVVFASSHASEQAAVSVLQSITFGFGVHWVQVEHTPVGDTQQTYNCLVESCQHTITPELWICELGFSSLDRWLLAYGNGTNTSELVEIDGDAGHGIDSSAIIAP